MGKDGHLPNEIFAPLIIETIKLQPVLWRLGSGNHAEMERAWTEVAEFVKIPKNELKIKWKSLKDTYRRILKRELMGDKNIKWAYYGLMDFMKPVMLSSDQMTSIVQIDENEYAVRSTHMSDNEEIIIVEYDQESVDSVPEKRNVSKKRKHDDDNGKSKRTPNILISDNDVLLNKRNQILTLTIDDDNADLTFFKTLIPYMKDMSVIQKLNVRNRIQHIILEELHNNVGTNVPKRSVLKNNQSDDQTTRNSTKYNYNKTKLGGNFEYVDVNPIEITEDESSSQQYVEYVEVHATETEEDETESSVQQYIVDMKHDLPEIMLGATLKTH